MCVCVHAFQKDFVHVRENVLVCVFLCMCVCGGQALKCVKQQREREEDRVRERQTDTQRDRREGKERGRQTHRETDGKAKRSYRALSR